MDKKAWIIVTICSILLGINILFTPGRQSTPQQQSPAPAEKPSVTPTAASSPQPAKNENTATADAAVKTVPDVVAPRPDETTAPVATLTSRDSKGQPVACFRFDAHGGSVRSVEMIGKAINSTEPNLHNSVQINSAAQHGIGTLMFRLNEQAPPVFDDTLYSLVPTESDNRRVTLEGRLGDRLVIRKTYSLTPLVKDGKLTEGHAYCLHLSVRVTNTASSALMASDWGVYAGTTAPISTNEWQSYSYYIRNEDKSFHKENEGSFRPWFSSNKDRIFTTSADTISWVGVMNQYYATLLQPAGAATVSSYYAAPVKGLVVPGAKKADTTGLEAAIGVPKFTLTAATPQQGGGSQTLEYDIFTGPKLNLMLSELTGKFHKIDYVMDYGIFHIISYPMNWLINLFYSWFGNWGWAIVAMTVVVRFLIWPLYRKSYVSMKSMSLLQPKIKEIREKYANDQQRAGQEMLKLYRDYGISPMGGCLPMFLQIPIFFSFFYVLQTAAEFRGAPFIAWVRDLSQMDTIATIPFLYDLPVNLLPIVMAVTMFLQMRMTPQAGGDPIQQRIMRFMPLFFLAFCYFYPSVLALYWTTTNIISIFQTWIIRRLPQPELKKQDLSSPRRKKGFLERLAEAQQAELRRRAAAARGRK